MQQAGSWQWEKLSFLQISLQKPSLHFPESSHKSRILTHTHSDSENRKPTSNNQKSFFQNIVFRFRFIQCSPIDRNPCFSLFYSLIQFNICKGGKGRVCFMMLCPELNTQIQTWLRDYDKIQSFAVKLIYIQVLFLSPFIFACE